MKSKYVSKVKKFFSEEMSKKYLMFKEVDQEISVENKLYLWSYSENLNFYIMLIFAPEKVGEAFTVECAFSKYKTFPNNTNLMCPLGVPTSEIVPSIPIRGTMYFRIGYLFDSPSDYWWWVRPNLSFKELSEWVKQPVTEDTLFMPQKVSDQGAMDNIKPMVEDAIDKIGSYALPYFETIIKEYETTPNYWQQHENYDVEKEKKIRLLNEYGGEIDKKCCMKSCENRRLKKVAYCLEHIYEEMKDKIQI